MEHAVPDWLTTEFLSDCLQDKEGRRSVATNFTVSPAAPPGSSYGSCLFRVEAEYKVEGEDRVYRSSLIVKSELTGPNSEFVDPFCEPAFYKKFLPEAAKLTDIVFAPKNFFSPCFTTVVMEDLCDRGFVMADKSRQLDFQHCRLYVLSVAELHAVSLAVHKSHPELVESMGKENMFSDDRVTSLMFRRMIFGGLASMSEAAKGLDRFSRYGKLLEDVSGVLWEMLVEAHTPSEVLKTLNHGDPWVPNMMFKYDDEGVVREVKLLYFQATRYGSPVNDIAFFVWMSADSDVRAGRLQELYDIYLETFNSKLEQLNCPEWLTRQGFYGNMKRLSPVAVFAVGVAHPPVTLSVNSQTDLGLFFKEDNDAEVKQYYKNYYSARYINEHFSKCMEHLESAGIFEYLEEYISCKKVVIHV